MKIAFLSRYQNTINRGAETFVKELTLRLNKSHDIDILIEDADSLKRILAGHYDIVIPINGGVQSLKASAGRIFGRYKLVITGQAGIGRGEIFNIAAVKPDVYVALTNGMAKWAKKFAWGSKVVKIPNGVDINKFSPNGEKINFDLPKPVILSVGALVWYKHHEKVIKAVGKLGYGSVVLVGEGEKRGGLEKLGKEVLGKRFKIENFKHEDMPKVYRSADLFTLPSWNREAFGIVYIEALASGLGVVAPDDESRREVVGNAGILTDVDDSEKYADALKKALDTDWSQKAVEQARQFSWDKVAKQYESLLLSLAI